MDETRSRNRFEYEYNFHQDPILDRKYRRTIRPRSVIFIEWIERAVITIIGSSALYWLVKHGW